MAAVSRFAAPTAGLRCITAATVSRCANGSPPTATAAMCTIQASDRGSPAIHPVASASSSTAEAYEEDCARAVLVVASRGEPPEDCRATVIGRALWRQRGALVLRRNGSGLDADFIIDSARPRNFDRPWASAAREAATSATVNESGEGEEATRAARDATPRQEDIEADQ